MQGYVYILATLVFSIYSQTVIKWKSHLLLDLPSDLLEKCIHIFWVLLNPWVISSILATLFAGISWMFVMSKFDVGFAYPVMSLNIVLMMWIGVFIFSEPISYFRIIGTLLIFLGLVIVYKGQ